jgi:hypothetical protein
MPYIDKLASMIMSNVLAYPANHQLLDGGKLVVTFMVLITEALYK